MTRPTAIRLMRTHGGAFCVSLLRSSRASRARTTPATSLTLRVSDVAGVVRAREAREDRKSETQKAPPCVRINRMAVGRVIGEGDGAVRLAVGVGQMRQRQSHVSVSSCQT